MEHAACNERLFTPDFRCASTNTRQGDFGGTFILADVKMLKHVHRHRSSLRDCCQVSCSATMMSRMLDGGKKLLVSAGQTITGLSNIRVFDTCSFLLFSLCFIASRLFSSPLSTVSYLLLTVLQPKLISVSCIVLLSAYLPTFEHIDCCSPEKALSVTWQATTIQSSYTPSMASKRTTFRMEKNNRSRHPVRKHCPSSWSQPTHLSPTFRLQSHRTRHPTKTSTFT